MRPCFLYADENRGMQRRKAMMVRSDNERFAVPWED